MKKVFNSELWPVGVIVRIFRPSRPRLSARSSQSQHQEERSHRHNDRHRRNEEQQRFSNNARYTDRSGYSDRKHQRPLYHDYNHGNFGSRFNGLNVG